MGMTMTLAMAYEVITQAVSSNEAARLPLIVLMDTLTIVVSINSMMAEMMTVIVMIHFLKPVSMIAKEQVSPGYKSSKKQKIMSKPPQKQFFLPAARPYPSSTPRRSIWNFLGLI